MGATKNQKNITHHRLRDLRQGDLIELLNGEYWLVLSVEENVIAIGGNKTNVFKITVLYMQSQGLDNFIRSYHYVPNEYLSVLFARVLRQGRQL